MAFDSYLLETRTLMYDLSEADIEVIDEKKALCLSYFNSLNKNIASLDKMMTDLQRPDKIVTMEQLIGYQSTWLNSSNTEKWKALIQSVIDKIIYWENQSNLAYKKGLTDMSDYVNRVTSPTNYSAPTYSIPSISTMPQLPKTTSCTISGDGGVGLQAYVNCTTY